MEHEMSNLSSLFNEKIDINHEFNTYIIFSKEKYFILNGEKHYFSTLDKISIFLDLATRPKFVFYKENKQTNSFKIVEIPSALAQDLINMFHVQADFGGYNSVVRDIK